MAKIKQSPKLPAEERRMQLLMAAQTLFAQKGFKETTADEIARKAGLTKGAIYFHFDNKEDILYELIKLVTSSFYDLVVQNEERLKSPLDHLKLFMDSEKLCCEHGDLVHNLDFWVQAMSIPRIKKHMNRSFKKMLNKFIECIDPVYGRTRADRLQMGILTYSLVDGLMVREVMDPSIVFKDKQYKLFDKMLQSFRDKKK